MPIEEPPLIPADRGLQVDDFFIFKHSTYQVWQCQSYNQSSPPVWAVVQIGEVRRIADGRDRAFVVTGSGQPNWVLAPTIHKLYPGVALLYPDGHHSSTSRTTKKVAKDM